MLQPLHEWQITSMFIPVDYPDLKMCEMTTKNCIFWNTNELADTANGYDRRNVLFASNSHEWTESKSAPTWSGGEKS